MRTQPNTRSPSICLLLLLLLIVTSPTAFAQVKTGSEPQSTRAKSAESGVSLFDQDNLMAWCIVPFDSAKRTPLERAEMLQKLGIGKFAYDYRAEHIPTFDDEIAQLQSHGIELSAWWFPGELNDEARLILHTLEKHNIRTQLWVTGNGGSTEAVSDQEQRRRVVAETQRLRPIVEAASAIGCSVGLYNHGGWFGEPDNQIAIIQELGLPNVGIVYNQHHGHEHVDAFAELLQRMTPHLFALNLNGMMPNGDQLGQKILPLGAGSLDLQLLKIIADSDYAGPIGILNHTDEDAEARLLDNIDGLRWLTKQLSGETAVPRPAYRSWKPIPPPKKQTSASSQGAKLFDGIRCEGKPGYRSPPLTLLCTATLTQQTQYNILVANETKASGSHWELFTEAGTGKLCVYLPGHQPDHVRSNRNICDAKPHRIAMLYEPNRVRLYVDAELIAEQSIERKDQPTLNGDFAIGRLVEGGFGCFGSIESVEIRQGMANPQQLGRPSALAELALVGAWTFESTPNAAASGQEAQGAEYDHGLLVERTAAIPQGNAARGAALFASAKSACLSCHKIGEFGGAVGPDLTNIGLQRRPEQIVEALLWPNRTVEPKYRVTQLLTDDGELLRGYVVAEDAAMLRLQEPSSGKEIEVAIANVELRQPAPSLMPEGLVNGWTRTEQLDILALLSDLGHHERLRPEIVASVMEHAQAHDPTPFPFSREPLSETDWPHWQADVNRQRIYDFYTKQANYFRDKDRDAQLLMGFPGLDGGTLTDAAMGHWGNQNEGTWASNNWNEATLGRLQAGVFHSPKSQSIPRSICLQLGDDGELNVCFDPQTLSYPSMWQGEFLQFSTVRHGFMHGLQAKGTSIDDPDVTRMAATPAFVGNQDIHYQGLYRIDGRVVFAYQVAGVDYLDAPWSEGGHFVREVAPKAKHSLANRLRAGGRQWPEKLETAITLGTQRPYAVDEIQLPLKNPWNIPIYCSGHDFLPDGSALVATMQGDVWHVAGFNDSDSKKAVWQRFASGLHHPLGVKIDETGIYVMCRDQLMRLHDENGDGEADFYECYCDAFETSAAGHDYICGLERDDAGNFYTASGNQGLVRISPDGQHATAIAAGFRNPDGLGIHPDGFATVPCSEGEWTPASMICAVPLDNSSVGNLPFHGYRGAMYASKPVERPQLPMVYLPRGLDNSAGGQVTIDSDRWGPLQGQMLHLSFGTGAHFLLLKDDVQGQLQGAVVPLPGEFLSGAHRGRFSPRDGQLYVCGMAGWGSYTPQRGCFQRVRHTGDQVIMPIGFHLYENGVEVRFSEPLTDAVCTEANEHFAQAWNYRYSAAYGSAEYSTKHYGVRGHDRLPIRSAHVIDEGRALFLEIPELQRCNQLHLQLAVAMDRRIDMFATCNQLDKARNDISGLDATPKQLEPHPIDLDMLVAMKKVPNPHRTPISGAREIVIEAGKELTYKTRKFSAKPGEALAIKFLNPDVVPHNWALVQPGTLQSVGEQANRLIANPEAFVLQYVPQTQEVICFTDVVEPNQEFTIYFHAPEQPGRYPYLCTFPGHWMVMNGEMIVEE